MMQLSHIISIQSVSRAGWTIMYAAVLLMDQGFELEWYRILYATSYWHFMILSAIGNDTRIMTMSANTVPTKFGF